MMNILNDTDLEKVSGGFLSIAGERKIRTDFIGPDAPQPDDGSMQQNQP
jgi:hypothetical protein